MLAFYHSVQNTWSYCLITADAKNVRICIGSAVILCRCEMGLSHEWEDTLRVFQNRALRIFRPKRE